MENTRQSHENRKEKGNLGLWKLPKASRGYYSRFGTQAKQKANVKRLEAGKNRLYD